MQRFDCERKITIPPTKLNFELKKNLHEVICQLENKCTEENGYVMSIDPNIRILDNFISADSHNIDFNVQYTGMSLRPRPGQILEGNVTLVSKRGIQIRVQEKFNILIVKTSLSEDWEYDNDEQIYHNTKTTQTIQLDTPLSVKITKVRYEDKSFSTIGQLYEETSDSGLSGLSGLSETAS